MIFTRTTKGSTNPIFHFERRQGTLRFDNPAFAMHPLGLHRVEPGALDWQRTDKDAHPLPSLLRSAVLLADPILHLPTDVPPSIIPHQNEDPFAHRLQLSPTPFQELGGHSADRTAIDKAQPGFLLPLPGFLRAVPQQQAITGQGFGRILLWRRYLLDQAQRFPIHRPGMQVRLGKAAPPGFILKPQRPIRMLAGQADQPVAALFFAHTPDQDW